MTSAAPAGSSPFPAPSLGNVAGVALLVLVFGLLGCGLGLAAWAPGRSPVASILLPVLWIMAPTRATAFAATAAYHLAVVRFLPDFAGTWMNDPRLGFLCWLGIGLACGAVWAAFWPRSRKPSVVALATCGALATLLLSPIAAISPGHPLVGWGFFAPGTGWLGVALMFLLSAAAASVVRSVASTGRLQQLGNIAGLCLLAAAFALRGPMSEPGNMRLAGRVGGVNTQLGGFPAFGSLEVMERLARIGRATMQLAGGDDEIQTVVFPEGIVGIYDPSLYPAMELEIVRPIARTGQTVLIGADLRSGAGTFQNIALVFRPDGSSAWIAARQTTPVTQWRPWNKDMHFPADWLASSTITLGGGVRARVMFCHEEWMPVLHLLSEAREPHNLVIAVSNLWAASDPVADYLQGTHSVGMARLFGRKLVRSVNLAKQKNGA